MKRTTVQLPFPEQSDRHLKVAVSACRLNLRPGGDPEWARGIYADPLGILPLKIETEGGEVRLSQEFDPTEISGGFEGLAQLDLELGTAKPYWLTVEGGASEANLDLGGLPILRLFVRQAASRYCLDFSEPNPQTLGLLHLSVGLGNLEIQRLANANPVEVVLEGGAAHCRLDLSGALRRAATVRVAMGLSTVEIVLPSTLAARIVTENVLGDAELAEGLQKRDGDVWTPAAIQGLEPSVTIRASSALGAVRVKMT